MPAAEWPEGLRADTVEALLELTWKLLDDERERDASFNTRAVGIAGFAGIIGTLAGAVSRDMLDVRLREPWETIAASIFVVAMAALGVTTVIVILGVLRPRESLSLGADEIRRYPTWEFVGADKALVHGRALRGLTLALLRQRERNDSKAKALHWAYRTLLAGLLAIVARWALPLVFDMRTFSHANDPQPAPKPAPAPAPASTPFERPSLDPHTRDNPPATQKRDA